MCGCCQRLQIDALMPPVLIYALKSGIKISSYWWFYKNKYTVKVEKLNWIQILILELLYLPRTCIRWCSLHIQVPKLHLQHYVFFFLCCLMEELLLVFNFFGAKPFLTIFGCMGRCRPQNMLYLSLSHFSRLPHDYSLIDDFQINTLAKTS